MGKLKNWVKNHKLQTVTIIVLVILLIAGAAYWIISSRPVADNGTLEAEKTTPNGAATDGDSMPAAPVADTAAAKEDSETDDAGIAGSAEDSGEPPADSAGQDGPDEQEQESGVNPDASGDQNAASTNPGVGASGEPEAVTPSQSVENTGDTGNADSGTSNETGGETIQEPPMHTHTWVDHTATRQVWVSNIVTVPDYETQTIQGARFYVPAGDGTLIANGPTYWFEDGFTEEDLKAIIMEGLKNADENGLYNGVSYSSYQNVTKTEQFQVGSHEEDQGYYEMQTYVDYQYCATCGQRK